MREKDAESEAGRCIKSVIRGDQERKGKIPAIGCGISGGGETLGADCEIQRKPAAAVWGSDTGRGTDCRLCDRNTTGISD